MAHSGGFEPPTARFVAEYDLLHAMQALSQLSYSPEFAIRRAIFRSLRQPSGHRHAHPLLGRMNMKWRPLGDSNPCYRRERAVWRSMLCTTTVSPSRTNPSIASSCGRWVSLPEALSVNSLPISTCSSWGLGSNGTKNQRKPYQRFSGRWIWYRPLRNATEEQIVHAARQQSHFLETVRGIRPLKLFQRQDERRSVWLGLLVHRKMPLQDRKITPENNPQAPPLLAFRTPETVPRLGFFPVNGPRVSGTPAVKSGVTADSACGAIRPTGKPFRPEALPSPRHVPVGRITARGYPP